MNGFRIARIGRPLGLVPFLLLGMTLATFAADEIHFTHTGQTSITFDWRGSSSENTISYGPSAGGYTTTVSAYNPPPPNVPYSSPGPFWEARLTGLQENTLYHYSIAGGPDHTFRTPPPPGADGFTVYSESDMQNNTANQTTLQQYIASARPAFVLIPGDVTGANSHGAQDVDIRYNEIMVWSQDSAAMPIWGNHDWDGPSSNDDLRNSKGRFDFPNPQLSPGAVVVRSGASDTSGEDWYWFDYGNTRFISYPEPYTSASWSDWNTKARTLMDQAQADPAIKFIITFGHRPAYSSGHHPGDNTLAGYMNALGDAHTKYVMNINGHSHNYERSFPQHGVTHITDASPSSFEQPWTIIPPPAWSATRLFHLGNFKLVFTNGTIQGSFTCGPSLSGEESCAAGTVFDTFVIGSGPGSDITPPQPPTVVSASAVSSSEIRLSWSGATDNVGVVGYRILRSAASGGPYAQITTTANTTYSNTGLAANTTYYYVIRAYDAAGNNSTDSSQASATTQGTADMTPPTVSLTAPAAGTMVFGTVTVTAAASDNVGVVGVQFKVDGANLGAEDTASPYSVSWNTAGVALGSHNLTAVARDAAGNQTTSAVVTVTVIADAPPATPTNLHFVW